MAKNLIMLSYFYHHLFLYRKCLLSQDGNLQSFQAVCVVIAILSWLLMRYTGLNVQVAVEACDTTSTTSDHGEIIIGFFHLHFNMLHIKKASGSFFRVYTVLKNP